MALFFCWCFEKASNGTLVKPKQKFCLHWQNLLSLKNRNKAILSAAPWTFEQDAITERIANANKIYWLGLVWAQLWSLFENDSKETAHSCTFLGYLDIGTSNRCNHRQICQRKQNLLVGLSCGTTGSPLSKRTFVNLIQFPNQATGQFSSFSLYLFHSYSPSLPYWHSHLQKWE